MRFPTRQISLLWIPWLVNDSASVHFPARPLASSLPDASSAHTSTSSDRPENIPLDLNVTTAFSPVVSFMTVIDPTGSTYFSPAMMLRRKVVGDPHENLSAPS